MSRPLESLSHKPTPFKFPRPGVPLSPPESNVDGTGPSTLPTSTSHPGNALRTNGIEPSPAHSTPTPGSAGARFRKISSITYLTSGHGDYRERAPQRSPKALIILMPPASLIEQHGQLGHTLASGPRHRLSNGLLMPLFPTMYGQLTAIAREFNFPSTAGLCLYLHFVEDGVTMTPRISDEIWPFMWTHVLESSSPNVPISGKIEFDLDIHQARWYASWLASSHRENIDHSFSVFPSSTPSVTHGRGDSKSTVSQEDDQEMIRSSVPTTRHAPRKLSLIDRYDASAAISGSRPGSRTGVSPPEHIHPSSSRILSPIFQDEEPKTAKQDLDDRVNTWRSGAIIKPTPSTTTRQSPEPTNTPNPLSINDPHIDAPDEQLDLEDFSWSVTSTGPDDYDPMSPVLSDRVSSVHIAHRMQGFVCLTPSDCTSFGPSDYTLSSPVPSTYRLPSPDIAFRMFQDAPPTPSTATTWGPPTEFPSSPTYLSRPPSVDLGDRVVFSRPVTPTTATSWGPASWPSSPVHSEHVSRSVHLGDRGEFSRPVTPSTATSWGAPLSWPPSPAIPFYVTTPDAGHRSVEDTDYTVGQNSVSWPSTISANGSPSIIRDSIDEGQQRRSIPWTQSWPYRKSGHTRPTPQISLHIPSIYPHLVIYQSIYPYFDLYPEIVLAKGSSAGYPDFNLYPDLSDHTTRHAVTVQKPISVRLTPRYPLFDLYPAAIYPENLYEIYPSVPANMPDGIVKSVSQYPFFDLYPVSRSMTSQRVPVMHTSNTETRNAKGYPHFDLYPEVNGIAISTDLKESGYPHFDLYPSAQSDSTLQNSRAIDVSVHVKTSYPFLNIYPAVYPQFNLYPPLTLLTPSVTKPAQCSVRLATYPVFDLYPAVYPAFDIYPPVERVYSPANKDMTMGVLGYPRIEIFPSLSAEEALSRKSQSVRVPSYYPSFNLYPSVYPFLELYPAPPHSLSDRAVESIGYPDFNLYPGGAHSLERSPRDHTEYVYPIFNLYPAVYPNFDLYPVIAGTVESEKTLQHTITVKVQASYPAFSLYSATYPHFELWPLIDLPRIELVPKPRANLLHESTHRELHTTMKMGELRSTSLKSRLKVRINSHADLHNAVFPDGIVTTPSGTSDDDRPTDVTLKDVSSSEALRRRVSTLRPHNAKLPLPASPRPARHLPPPSSETHNINDRSTRVIGPKPVKDNASKDEISSLQTSPWRTSLSQFPQDVGLLDRRVPSFQRTSLLNDPSLRALMSENTSRPKSVVSPPRRRDSLVSHRARVYNGSRDNIQLPMETLYKLPALPDPPAPSAPPKPLDDLNHPYVP